MLYKNRDLKIGFMKHEKKRGEREILFQKYFSKNNHHAMAIIGYNHFRWFYHKQLFSTNLQRTGKKKNNSELCSRNYSTLQWLEKIFRTL